MFGYYKSVKSYLDLAYHPVESAMTNGDDLVHLLVRLGASVNTVPKTMAQASYLDNKNKISLKLWIDSQISKLDALIKSEVKPPATPAAPIASITTPPEYSGWQKFYREYQESLKTSFEEEQRRQVKEREEKQKLEKLEKLEDTKAYFVEVKQLFEKYNAEVFGETSTNETPLTLGWQGDAPTPDSNPYKILSHDYYARDVPQHLLSSYDQLYEACYAGDHEKIQSLCLPAEGTQPGSILLNISVKMVDSTDNNYNGKRTS